MAVWPTGVAGVVSMSGSILKVEFESPSRP